MMSLRAVAVVFAWSHRRKAAGPAPCSLQLDNKRRFKLQAGALAPSPSRAQPQNVNQRRRLLSPPSARDSPSKHTRAVFSSDHETAVTSRTTPRSVGPSEPVHIAQ
ncbi:hypothetical protein EVAR_13809_1 [Eumeta japonica]|uniref:Uncharacterized protein n=1 Tax=Eumeta variegata TaxID=151549 RepID=A0A4C1U172_EUMVA|nr:hypothetical protein EVAR_13809_1 [Eumeta japonica]